MRYHTSSRLAVAAAFLFSSPAVAEEHVTVAPVVVTASRTAETADESLSSVSVITRKEIERTQATSLPELLGRVQGVEFSQSGGRGNISSVFIRGTNSDHVIVLIDGIRVGSATSGTTAFETLPLDNIERIEVVRGPRSSLYGSSAIGGVIQIFTRESQSPYASVSGGSHDFRQMNAGHGYQEDGSGFSVDLSFEETDGFDVHENDPSEPFYGSEPDDDGFESASISVRGYRDLTANLQLTASALLADSEIEFDGTSQNKTEQRQGAGSIRLDWTVDGAWQSGFILGRTSDDSDNFLNGNQVSEFDTTRTNFRWQNDFTLAGNQIVTAGLDVLQDEIHSDTDFAVTERETLGAFMQHQWSGRRWDTQLSLRHDSFDEGFDNPNSGGDQLDDETTGSLAVSYGIKPGLRAFSSYGTAFHAPTFNDLFFPFASNPNLDPEKSETIEIGLRGTASIVRWEVTAYRTEIDDLITFDLTTFKPQNIEQAAIQGVEIGLNADWDEWRAALNTDFKNPENAETGEQLPRRAKHNFRGSLTRSIGLWSLGTDVAVQGERFDSNGARLDSYALIDLRAAWNFAPDWRATFKVNNAGDADYQLADGFNRDERNFLFQLDWRPDESGSR